MKQHRPEKLGKDHTTYKPKARRLSLKSAAWRRLRAQVLAEEPLCRYCLAQGRYVVATDVDHKQNGNGDYTDDSSRENLQALCHECHSEKTRAEMQGKEQTVKGCDVNGIPLDPEHSWRREITSNRDAKYRRGSLKNTAERWEF